MHDLHVLCFLVFVYAIILSINIKFYNHHILKGTTISFSNLIMFQIMCSLRNTKLKLCRVKVENGLSLTYIERFYDKHLGIIFDSSKMIDGQFIN